MKRRFLTAQPDPDGAISGSLDRCGYSVQLLNDLILAPLLQLPGLLPEARCELAGVGPSLRQRLFSKAGCPVKQQNPFPLNLVAGLFPRLGRQKQHRRRTGHAADEHTDDKVPCIPYVVSAIFVIVTMVTHFVISLMAFSDRCLLLFATVLSRRVYPSCPLPADVDAGLHPVGFCECKDSDYPAENAQHAMHAG
jgi:hypothetical protein